MNRFLTTLTLALAFFLSASIVTLPAVAAPHGEGEGHPRQNFIERHDANGDGEVTADEYDGRIPFERVDFNGDGVITQSDFAERIAERVQTHITLRAIVKAGAEGDGENGVSLSEFSDYLTTLDTDSDGALTREELSAMRMRDRSGEGEGRGPRGRRFQERGPRFEGPHGDGEPRSVAITDLESTFSKFDEDGDNIVTRDEFPQRRQE